jgi:hypothetical protein
LVVARQVLSASDTWEPYQSFAWSWLEIVSDDGLEGLTESVQPGLVEEVAVHVEGVRVVVAVHHQVVHLLRRLPVTLPLVDEPVVDLLQV